MCNIETYMELVYKLVKRFANINKSYTMPYDMYQVTKK